MGILTNSFSHFKVTILCAYYWIVAFISIIWILFICQAMEMLRLTKNSPLKNTGFQNYFEAFIENKSDYVLKEDEVEVGTLNQTLPYVIFLVSPILLVLLIAIQKKI